MEALTEPWRPYRSLGLFKHRLGRWLLLTTGLQLFIICGPWLKKRLDARSNEAQGPYIVTLRRCINKYVYPHRNTGRLARMVERGYEETKGGGNLIINL